MKLSLKGALLLAIALMSIVSRSFAQNKDLPNSYSTLRAQNKILNPLLPGYFADPTIKKFGDIYYIYATTDNIMLASGAPTVWYSKDFENWYNYTMDVPAFTAEPLTNFWAPDVVFKNNRYYLYFGNCEMGCNIYGYVSDTPVGPWKKLSDADNPVIPHDYPRPGFPSLDAQFFTDDDQKIYGYWGTWVHYNGGYAVGELNSQSMSNMQKSTNIPLAQTPGPFEAPYMMKKGDKYLLMYSGGSCHDETYNVRYAYAHTPYGPFKEGANNPILSTNADKTVHGPGHHSVLQDGDDYYIIYHKHDYPMTRGGLARQVCVDRLIFENDSTIKKVEPQNTGYINPSKQTPPVNLALNKDARASSEYHLQDLNNDYEYKASFVTDDNNATLWKAGSNLLPQDLTIDLGAEKRIRRIMTQFEFPAFYYQYMIKYSADGKSWKLFADQSKNRTPGSPMIDDKDVKARFIKLTVTGTEKQGLYAAIWNIKVYDGLFDMPLHIKNKISENAPALNSKRQMLLNINAADYSKDQSFKIVKNKGVLGGIFKKNGDVTIEKDEAGITAFKFTNGSLQSDQPVPQTLAWNGSYTVAAWVKTRVMAKEGGCLMSWCNRNIMRLANSYNAMYFNSGGYGAAGHLDYHFDMKYNHMPQSNKWHYIVLTFDGISEKIYVDGKLDNAQMMTLSSAIKNAKFIIGASDIGENFTGYIASLKMYDYALNFDEIQKQLHANQSLK
ncbi:family 43 glycosylhydrolase [Mucilaginibacter sp. KACC 22063]|uniref:family 43 glycosylhydrolase n=1 Tax=Mucilaginibacter sp. KACC 22063 TaxID=3025666 RepID=UPI002365E5C0|nr:family 43 glycosylhydrolase [Mucilaginibacter sp. KACC 22063]WDF53691.1 family 43 glycosylhydrolase [Mucilaginibacter sp. KACC 22063]